MAKAFSGKILLCGVWLAAVGLGTYLFLRFQSAPGSAGVAPDHWPMESRIPLDASRDTLILFAHPQCPCTRASIEELNRILARSGGRLVAHVLFVQPTNAPADWLQTDRWQSAAAIPGVKVEADPEGRESRRFGASTSGYTVLYGPEGRLLFAGGITSARGHIGDNAGANLVVSLAAGKKVPLSHTPVFGCSLLGECSRPAQ